MACHDHRATSTAFICAIAGIWACALAGCVPSPTSGSTPPDQTLVLEQWKLAVSVLGFTLTLCTLGFGLRQYVRAEKWKRAEFLAKEAKEFFGNPWVRTALLLSDWGDRRFKLMKLVDPGDETVTRVTRDVQVRALLPHTMVDPVKASDSESDSAVSGRYSPAQAVLRDCYDAYLDGLECFGSYLLTGLVSAGDLRPYLGYWIDDLAAPTDDPGDAAWSATVITYIQVYDYEGVVHLFGKFGHDIGPNGAIYRGFTARMEDQELAGKLIKASIEAAASRER